MVFSPFNIAITSLGKERANLSAFRTFVRFVLVWIRRFPLPLGVWEGVRFVIVALPGLFSYLFPVSARYLHDLGPFTGRTRGFCDPFKQFSSNHKIHSYGIRHNCVFSRRECDKNEDNSLSTDIHIKPTDVHQYLHFSSCHPRNCKEGIPYNQAKRYRRIISNDDSFHGSFTELGKYFQIRHYPDNVIIKSDFQKVSTITQEEALVSSSEKNKQKNIIRFVVQYNASLPNLGLTINKYWDLFNLSNKESLNFLHKHKPVVTYKKS